MNVLVISDAQITASLGKGQTGIDGFLQANGCKVSMYEIRRRICITVRAASAAGSAPRRMCGQDISRDINKSFIGSNIAIFVSLVKYGCHAPAVRRALDRMLPNILPYFRKIKGEVHHKPRYRKYPNFAAFGYGEDITDGEADTFRSLCAANAINLQAKKAETYIIREETELDDILDSFGKYIEECEKR